jgi:DDE superfamily endonuclease
MAWAEAGPGSGDRADQARERLAGFRRELYWCLGRRRDALFELADAVLCGQGRVQMLAELSLEPEHQRGHGALYDALNCGSIQIARLRWALAAVPLPGWEDG